MALRDGASYAPHFCAKSKMVINLVADVIALGRDHRSQTKKQGEDEDEN
ncbi:MAG TPA: hypothetical protein VN025_16260 [Candidatus Dormibacteraeota bacterium]|nr:hypothetical protein [Candidatus Dormibacteraeota bacterium]